MRAVAVLFFVWAAEFALLTAWSWVMLKRDPYRHTATAFCMTLAMVFYWGADRLWSS